MDLYGLPTEPAFIPCGGGNDPDGDSEACVTLAPIVGVDGAVELGDTKAPDRPGLRFTSAEVDTFAVHWVRTRGLTA